MKTLRASHTRSDSGQHENAFQSFSKNENADVEERYGRAGVGPRRIRRAMCSDALPDQHRDHKKRGCDGTDAQNDLHFG